MSSRWAFIAGGLVRTMEGAGIRGAPTILRLLSRVSSFRSTSAIARLPEQQKIKFPAFDPYWARYLWAGKKYEPDVELIFRRLGALKGKLLVDCGANIGYWTVKASAPDFGFTDFIAVEAHPRLVPILRENVRLNSIKCEVHHAAIHERSGETVLLGGTEHHAIAGVAATGVPVQTTSLFTLLQSLPADQVAVVKLDVEGSEIPAIRGAAGLEDKNIIYVFEDWPEKDGGGMQVAAYFLEQGYAAIGVAADGKASRLTSPREVMEFNRATNSVHAQSNLIACNPDLLDRILPLFD